jgi:hypothetical protein
MMNNDVRAALAAALQKLGLASQFKDVPNMPFDAAGNGAVTTQAMGGTATTQQQPASGVATLFANGMAPNGTGGARPMSSFERAAAAGVPVAQQQAAQALGYVQQAQGSPMAGMTNVPELQGAQNYAQQQQNLAQNFAPRNPWSQGMDVSQMTPDWRSKIAKALGSVGQGLSAQGGDMGAAPAHSAPVDLRTSTSPGRAHSTGQRNDFLDAMLRRYLGR